MKKKKIIEIIPQLNSGGAERFVVDLCNELIKYHKVTIIVLFPLETHGFYKKELNRNVKIISLNKKTGLKISIFYKIFLILKREKADIVHTHLNCFYYTIFSNIFLGKKINFFHTIHNDALKEAPGKLGVHFKKKIFEKNYSIPITISNESNRSFNKEYKFKSNVIPNGRNFQFPDPFDDEALRFISKIKTSKGTKILINVARLSKQKNQILLIKCVQNLNELGYDIQLLIIGSFLDRDILNQIQEIKDENIHVLGEKSNVIDYVRLADGFCLSSMHEGLPISLIEAMSLGTIPICTPAGGVQDLIKNGENGFISTGFSFENYNYALKNFLDTNIQELNLIKINCLQTGSLYSIEKCADLYLKLFGLKN